MVAGSLLLAGCGGSRGTPDESDAAEGDALEGRSDAAYDAAESLDSGAGEDAQAGNTPDAGPDPTALDGGEPDAASPDGAGVDASLEGGLLDGGADDTSALDASATDGDAAAVVAEPDARADVVAEPDAAEGDATVDATIVEAGGEAASDGGSPESGSWVGDGGPPPPICSAGCACGTCSPACPQGTICASGACVPTSLYVVASGLSSPTRPYYAGSSVVFGDVGTGTVYVMPESGGPPVVLASAQSQLGAPITDGTYAYWTYAGEADGGTEIVRAPLDATSAPQTILTGVVNPALYTISGSTLLFTTGYVTESMPADGSAAPTAYFVFDLLQTTCWGIATDSACYATGWQVGGSFGAGESSNYWYEWPWNGSGIVDINPPATMVTDGLVGDQKTAFFTGFDYPTYYFQWFGPSPGGGSFFDNCIGLPGCPNVWTPRAGDILTASSCGAFVANSTISFSHGPNNLSPITSGPGPSILAADLESDTLYWNDPGGGTLMRAPVQ
jgi:hypothetical protein